MVKKYKKIIGVFISAFVLVYTLSCNKDNTIDTEPYITVQAFDTLELLDPFDVYLTEDTIHSVKIVASPKLAKQVFFNVVNGVLKVSYKANNRWIHPNSNKIKLFVSVKKLSRLISYEPCNIQTTNTLQNDVEFGLILKGKLNEASLNLNCKTFYFWNDHPCGGKLTLTGEVETLKLWNFAIMSVNAVGLNAKNALVENQSQGDCEVFVQDRLEYSIRGIGNIQLYGKPNDIVLGEKSSSGELIRH